MPCAKHTNITYSICQDKLNCYVGSAACIGEISIYSKGSLKTWFGCRHPFRRHLLLGDESHPCFLVCQADGAEGATLVHTAFFMHRPHQGKNSGQAGVTGLSLPDNKQSTSSPSEPPSTCPPVHTALKIMSFRGRRGQQLNLIEAEQRSHRKLSFWGCCLLGRCVWDKSRGTA